MKLIQLAILLQISKIVLHFANLHHHKRDIIMRFMLFSDIVILFTIGKLYIEKKKIVILLPLIVAIYNFLYSGHNIGSNNDGDGYQWGLMNGLSLSILGYNL